MDKNYIEEVVPGGVPVKMWTRGVPVEDEAKRQLTNAARLPIVFKHIAAMPNVHFGIGATVSPDTNSPEDCLCLAKGRASSPAATCKVDRSSNEGRSS
jgi:hypothetical protein